MPQGCDLWRDISRSSCEIWMRFQFLQDHVAETYNNLSLFFDITFCFHSTTPSRVMLKLAVLARYKVVNCQISLTFLRGIELSALLALGGWVNPISNLILSPSMLEHSLARRTEMSLRVTKCHRAAIFDMAYLGARAKYGCDSSSYKTMLWRPTITSLTFWRSHSIFILRHHLGWCWLYHFICTYEEYHTYKLI